MRQVVRRACLRARPGPVALLTGCAGQLVAGQASPGAGEPVDVAADAFPITGVSDDPVDQLARNALADLNAFWSQCLPRVLRRRLHPAEERLLLRRLQRDRRQRLPRHRHRLRGLAHDARRGRRQRVLRPGLRPDRLRPGAARGAVHRLRPLPRPGRHGPRVRARHAGPVRLRRQRAQHPGRDAGRLLRRRLDRLGRRRATPSTSRCAPRARRRHPRLPPAARRRRQRPQRQPGARLLLRPGLGVLRGVRRRGRLVPGRLRADRLFTAAPFASDDDYINQGNAPVDDIVAWTEHDAAGVLGDGVPPAFGTDFTPPKIAEFDGTAPDCDGRRRTATWATAPPTPPSTWTRPTWPSPPTTRSATSP